MEGLNSVQSSDNRKYPAHPLPGVGVVVVKDGRVLLVKRAREPNKGKWSIPGGRIELGETIYEAGRREVLEECSVRVEIERVLGTGDVIIRDAEGRIMYHYVLVDLLAGAVEGEARAGSDAAECRWVSPRELADMDVTPRLQEALARAGLGTKLPN